MKRFITLAIAAFFSFPSVCHAGVLTSTIDDQEAVEVTVYNSNIALVKDLRSINLPQGVGELRFMDVASTIQPVTVAVKSLTAPNQFMVLEQNYEYDLMNAQKLMDKYVGKTVKLIEENKFQGTSKEIKAELLSNNNGQIYKINNEIYLGYQGRVVLPEIPENLIAKPTLTWMFQNQHGSTQQIEVSYLANQVNWVADYVMTIDKDDTAADLNGWVTINNRSGAQFKDATLKLVAGDVNRVAAHSRRKTTLEAAVMEDSVGGSGFQEEAFFEYHIYDLQRPTTIKNNQTKQISLLSAAGAGIEKEFMVRGEEYYFQNRYQNIPKSKVGVYIKFKNEEANKLGMPLPAGTIRLYKEDSKGKMQFIGEDRIDHTPKDEEVSLKIGDAFDVVAERRQMDFQRLGNRAIETEWEVVIRNHKDEDIVVTVIEPVNGEWYITQKSHNYEKLDAHRIKFQVPVAKDAEAVLRYRVRVSFR